MSAARFEVVRTDADQPWHARFRAANGRIVWTTEQYARRGGAENAIFAVAQLWTLFQPEWGGHPDPDHRRIYVQGVCADVHYLDEREARP